MIAKQLEAILLHEAASTDFSHRSSADLAQRFQSLRGFGLLPRGRGKNAQHLTSLQAVAGILSLVAEKPGFAGTASKILLKLKPVGGVDASFQGARTFGAALVNILEKPDARDAIVEVRASGSEIFTNGYGRGTIVYVSGGEARTAYYVGETALTLMGRGAERTFGPCALIPTTIKETVYFRGHFERLARELQIEYPEHAFDHLIDPDEEEIEHQKEERRRRLGITSNSRYLNVAVDTQATWPKEETVVEFEGYKIILMPRTRDNTTSLHIDLHGQKITSEDARTLFNRFLSLMTWCDDQFAILGEGWSGNPVPVAVPKPDLAFSTAYQWAFDRNIPESHEAQRALAIYREARNAHQNHIIPYAVLSYYKIIELKYKKTEHAKSWIKEKFQKIRKNQNLTDSLSQFESECSQKKEEPEDYIWASCRCAVAHAKEPFKSTDADDLLELRRLYVAADILRALARLFIRDELEISDCIYDGT